MFKFTFRFSTDLVLEDGYPQVRENKSHLIKQSVEYLIKVKVKNIWCNV